MKKENKYVLLVLTLATITAIILDLCGLVN